MHNSPSEPKDWLYDPIEDPKGTLPVTPNDNSCGITPEPPKPFIDRANDWINRNQEEIDLALDVADAATNPLKQMVKTGFKKAAARLTQSTAWQAIKEKIANLREDKPSKENQGQIGGWRQETPYYQKNGRDNPRTLRHKSEEEKFYTAVSQVGDYSDNKQLSLEREQQIFRQWKDVEGKDFKSPTTINNPMTGHNPLADRYQFKYAERAKEFGAPNRVTDPEGALKFEQEIAKDLRREGWYSPQIRQTAEQFSPNVAGLEQYNPTYVRQENGGSLKDRFLDQGVEPIERNGQERRLIEQTAHDWKEWKTEQGISHNDHRNPPEIKQAQFMKVLRSEEFYRNSNSLHQRPIRQEFQFQFGKEIAQHPGQVQSWLTASVSDLNHSFHDFTPDQKSLARMYIAGHDREQLKVVAFHDNPRFEGWSSEARHFYIHERIEKGVFGDKDVSQEAKAIDDMKKEYHLQDNKNYDHLKKVEGEISRMNDTQKAAFKEQMRLEYEVRHTGQELPNGRNSPEVE